MSAGGEGSPSVTPDTSPNVDHELRLAVVMYGGVSLAIYIYGVAQELFNLVRATADAGEEAQGSNVSRHAAELAQVYRDATKFIEAPPGSTDSPRRTKVVIDILSGASAGGINSIFLAKALATGQPVAALRKIWVEEGEVAKLLNDDLSRTELLAKDELPPSLFNGNRMYEKLLEALRSMDAKDAKGAKDTATLADDLDLFVTLTDLQGFDVPLGLHDAEQQVHERRHRTELHFRLDRSQGRNDFERPYDPLLAFAARSTSSIPFVFAASQLGAGAALAARVSAQDYDSPERVAEWSRFFPRYRSLRQQATPTGSQTENHEHARRSFVDGGVLNNKPFDHAVQALVNRRGAMSVTRKLFYIEPSPDHQGASARQAMSLDPFTIGLEGLSLPRHETIREDLERILVRNRQIDRVRTLTMGAAEDRESDAGPDGLSKAIGRDVFESSHLAALIRTSELGAGYGGHHRLKVAQVTDDVARTFGQLVGVGESDDQIATLRDNVVQPWRVSEYERERSNRVRLRTCKELEPETAFLLAYDLAYRLRRLHFVLERIDEWLGRHRSLVELLARGVEPSDPRLATMLKTLDRVGRAVGLNVVDAELVRQATFECHLRALRKEIGAILTRLQSNVTALHHQADSPTTGTDDDIHKQLAALQEAAKDAFNRIVKLRGDTDGNVYAFHGFALMLKQAIDTIKGKASAECKALFAPALTPVEPDASKQAKAEHVARAIVADAYWDFERFDMVRFPVMTLAGIGEELASVEVHRISPRDATFLVDEAKTGGRKLAGTAISNFGAFFDVRWREADIAWGRLDAAEMLISAMVPEGYERDNLIERAQAAILACEKRTRDDMEASVATRPALDRHAVATSSGRAARVLSRLLDDLRHQRPRIPGLGPMRAAALTFGTLLTALVAVAVPTSFANLVGRHAATLVAIVFGIIFAIGFVIPDTNWRYYGGVGLIIVGLWSLMTWNFGWWLARRTSHPFIRVGFSLVKLLIVVLLAASLVVGAIEIATALGVPGQALVESNRSIVATMHAQPAARSWILAGTALLGLGVASARQLARYEERQVPGGATEMGLAGRNSGTLTGLAWFVLMLTSFAAAAWVFQIAFDALRRAIPHA